MDMKCYEFKDSRRIFRWIYFIIAINILSNAISVISSGAYWTTIFSMSLGQIIICIIVYLMTRTNVFIGDDRLKAKSTIHYMMINDIEVNKNIYLKSDNKTVEIKLIDLENNYDKYKELLEVILQKVSKKVKSKAGSAEKLMQSAHNNLKTRFSSKKLADGRVELGGWLSLFNVSAYLFVILGAMSIVMTLISIIMQEMEFTSLVVQMALIVLPSLAIIYHLNKRNKAVKYALALLLGLGMITTIVFNVIVIVNSSAVIDAVFVGVRTVMSVITSIFMIRVYFDYIDKFERPKQTLIN